MDRTRNLKMSALIAKKNKIDIPRLIIALFMYLRVAFGLQLVMDSSKNRILAPNVQRTIAFIWFVLYMASTMITKKIELVTEIHFRNSLLMQALPTFMTATMCVSTVLTLLFTHYFANARKSLIKEVLNIDNTLEPKNIALDSKGAPLIAAIGIIQILYMIFWFVLSGPLDYYKDLTMFDRILTIIPRLVSTFFLLDYFTGVTILIQQFTKNNEALEVLRDKSLQVKNFPKDERLFQQQILDIADRHRKLSKIVKRTNGIYALQLLVNIAVIYAFILARTYMAIYVILSSFQSGFAIKMAAVCLVHLALNATTLLLLVEITSRLCQEAENTKLILWSIRVSEIREESINTMMSCSFQIAHSKVEMWAFNMFKVDYSLIFAVVSSITTYLFLMIQFELNSGDKTVKTTMQE